MANKLKFVRQSMQHGREGGLSCLVEIALKTSVRSTQFTNMSVLKTSGRPLSGQNACHAGGFLQGICSCAPACRSWTAESMSLWKRHRCRGVDPLKDATFGSAPLERKCLRELSKASPTFLSFVLWHRRCRGVCPLALITLEFAPCSKRTDMRSWAYSVFSTTAW